MSFSMLRHRCLPARPSYWAFTVLLTLTGCGDPEATPTNISGVGGPGGSAAGGSAGAPQEDARGTSTSASTSAATGGAAGIGGAGVGGAAGSAGGDLDAALDAARSSDADASASNGGDAALVCGATHGTQDDPMTTGDGNSAIAAPYNTPPEALIHLDGAPTGTVTGPLRYEIKVNYVDLKYQYWIYVPKQYKAGCRAALMVFQDAIHYVGLANDGAKFNTPTVFDNLIHKGDMPITIGLFVNPGEPNGIYD